MQPRIENPAVTVAGAFAGSQKLGAAIRRTGVPATTLALVQTRASQINGCSVCLDMHTRELKAAGEPDQRTVNAATRQITGDWIAQYIEPPQPVSKAA